MKKHFMVTSGAVCLATLLTVSSAVSAVDQAASCGVLAGASTLVVMSQQKVADAAKSGDVDALEVAQTNADAVYAAVAEAQDAYNAMMAAITSGDEGAAGEAYSAMITAFGKANNAIGGNFSVEDTVNSAVNVAGRQGDVPNIFSNPSDTSAMQGVMQNVFGSFWETSAYGSRQVYDDRQVTPD